MQKTKIGRQYRLVINGATTLQKFSYDKAIEFAKQTRVRNPGAKVEIKQV